MSKFYATLAKSQGGPGCVEVEAENRVEAREKVFKHLGDKWSFLYDSLEEVHPFDRDVLREID